MTMGILCKDGRIDRLQCHPAQKSITAVGSDCGDKVQIYVVT